MDKRQIFLTNMAQTSSSPLMLEIERAEGCWLYDRDGNKYLDLISGISVSNLGHGHPHIIEAIKKQADAHLYLMVYGEYVQSPQVQLAHKLAALLPPSLSCTYFVNSGSEAVEGALKLAGKYTGRSGVACFENAYHGCTYAAMSVTGNEKHHADSAPLMPGTLTLKLNDADGLQHISEETACVIVEPVQGEAGMKALSKSFAVELRQRCTDTGALLIFDEIQTGMGRTGSMFRFEQLEVVPDVLLLAKALGGGMPLGAFIASAELMHSLNSNPELDHLTTFGGHPLCCAAATAALEVLEREALIPAVAAKEQLFLRLLRHPLIRGLRSAGLMIAVELDSFRTTRMLIDKCREKGVISDWFLFCDNSMRIAPPLTIDEDDIRFACQTILRCLDEVAAEI